MDVMCTLMCACSNPSISYLHAAQRSNFVSRRRLIAERLTMALRKPAAASDGAATDAVALKRPAAAGDDEPQEKKKYGEKLRGLEVAVPQKLKDYIGGKNGQEWDRNVVQSLNN